MTDDIREAISEIGLDTSTLIMQFQGHYRALFKLRETLSYLLDKCDLNLQCIRIIPNGDGEEPVQRAIGLTDLPALEKELLISTAVTSTVAIKVLAGIFRCDFETAASHVEVIGELQFGSMTPEAIERAIEEIAKNLKDNPDGASFFIEVED